MFVSARPGRLCLALGLAVVAAASPLASASSAQGQAPSNPGRAPDLADTVAGSYAGAVISDARGSSRSDVRLTVTRTGRNTVRVTSDYPRLPAFTTGLVRVMQTIQTDGTDVVFLLDLSKQPPSLDVTVDDASWSGVRE